MIALDWVVWYPSGASKSRMSMALSFWGVGASYYKKSIHRAKTKIERQRYMSILPASHIQFLMKILYEGKPSGIWISNYGPSASQHVEGIVT